MDINQRDFYRGSAIAFVPYPNRSPEVLLLYLQAGGVCPPELLLELAGHDTGWGRKLVPLPGDGWSVVRDWLKEQRGIDPADVLTRFEEYRDSLEGNETLRATLALARPLKWLPADEDRAARFFDDPQVLALIRAIERDDIAEIDRLAEAGVDFNAKGKKGVTPLFWATQSSLRTFVRVLGADGVDPNAQLSSAFYPHPYQPLGKGATIVHWAARYGDFEHLLFVLQAGGNPNSRSAYSERTTLFETLDIANLGLDRGQDVENVIAMYGDPEDLPKRSRMERRFNALSLLKLAGADFDAQDVWGRTPLMIAVKNHGRVLAFMLLQFGAGCLCVDEMGYDVILQLVQDMRFDAWNYNLTKTADERQRRREAWQENWRTIVRIIEDRGGDFDLAEKTVWKGDDWLPAIDLTKLPLKDRKWLPPAGASGNSSSWQQPGERNFPGIIEEYMLPVMGAYRSPPDEESN